MYVPIQRGGGGGGGQAGSDPPEKSHKYRGNAGQDSLKNHKATKLAFNVGPSSAQ